MITNDLEIVPVGSPRYFKTLHLACGSRQEVCLRLVNADGEPINLGSREAVMANICKNADCDEGIDNDNPGFEDGIEPKADWPDVTLRLRAIPGYGQPPVFDVKGKVLDYKNGQVVFHLTQKHSTVPGVYIASIGLFRDELLMAEFGAYVSIEPSVFDTTYAGTGMITVPEVRLALRDSMPEDNFLLDALEFKDAEIFAAMRYAIDKWNAELPIDPVYNYTMQNFPFRYPWLRATVGYLLETAAHWYRRNALPTSAGGITINDRGKFPEYQEKSRELRAEYDQWVKQAKASISMMSAFGQVTSPFYNNGGIYGA